MIWEKLGIKLAIAEPKKERRHCRYCKGVFESGEVETERRGRKVEMHHVCPYYFNRRVKLVRLKERDIVDLLI